MTSASRFVLVALALVGVAILGDLRSEASESRQPAGAASTRVETKPVFWAAREEALSSPAAESAALVQIDVDGNGLDPATPDETGRLVPALYAWDPDVRFVYFRHVSKWM